MQAVEAINNFYKNSGKNLLLMTSGRVGTSSPELGVPVSFHSISNFSAVCEVSDCQAGYAGVELMIQMREVDGLYFWLDSLSNHAICGWE